MKRLPSFHLSLAATASIGAFAALTACGGISDPSRGSDGTVATVTGALTGTDVPANTRVALVWRAGDSGAYAVGSDVAVTDGKFTMNLATPSDGYFFTPDEDRDSISGGSSSSGAVDPTGPNGSGSGPTATASDDAGADPGASSSSSSSGSSGSKSFAFASNVAPRDVVSGQISKPFQAAVAGFVVYVDTNGNGKLDISGEYAASTDEVIGGNKELALLYFREGGTLDYEKLRDTSSILPKAGYNLAWSGRNRWLPLNAVDLKLTTTAKLPSNVCARSYDSYTTDPSAEPPPVAVSVDAGAGGSNGYPDPNDPALHCYDEGRSYYIEYSNCSPTTPTPQPVGLCAPDYDYGIPEACTGGGGPSYSLTPGEPVPEGWPCPVAIDAGTPTVDAGADASVPDGG